MSTYTPFGHFLQSFLDEADRIEATEGGRARTEFILALSRCHEGGMSVEETQVAFAVWRDTEERRKALLVREALERIAKEPG